MSNSASWLQKRHARGELVMPSRPLPVRPLPRSFDLPWGQGEITEEATITTRYHAPAIQLLEFSDGSQSIRFCYYDLQGRFQRSPLLMSETALPSLRQALRACPRLRRLLRKLIA
jgi:hypothetical protein